MGQFFVLPAYLVYIVNTKHKNKPPVASFDLLTTWILYQPSKLHYVVLQNKHRTAMADNTCFISYPCYMSTMVWLKPCSARLQSGTLFLFTLECSLKKQPISGTILGCIRRKRAKWHHKLTLKASFKSGMVKHIGFWNIFISNEKYIIPRSKWLIYLIQSVFRIKRNVHNHLPWDTKFLPM